MPWKRVKKYVLTNPIELLKWFVFIAVTLFLFLAILDAGDAFAQKLSVTVESVNK